MKNIQPSCIAQEKKTPWSLTVRSGMTQWPSSGRQWRLWPIHAVGSEFVRVMELFMQLVCKFRCFLAGQLALFRVLFSCTITPWLIDCMNAFCYIPVVQHSSANAKVMGSLVMHELIKCTHWGQYELLWIKVSAKCMHVNVYCFRWLDWIGNWEDHGTIWPSRK